MSRLKSARPGSSRMVRFTAWPLAAAAALALAWLAFSSAGRNPGNPPVAGGKDMVSPVGSGSQEIPPAPLESRQHLMEVTDLGIVENAEKRPVRLIRTTWVDEIYYPPAEGSAIPLVEGRVRQEILPVAVSTY